VGGVQPQSETVWRQADRYRVPRIAFINKVDRVGADPERCVAQIRERLRANPVVGQIPVGLEDRFAGGIDLITMKAMIWRGEETGARFDVLDLADVPEAHADEARAAREQMIERLGEVDDEVMALYLEGKPPSEEQIRAALRRATISMKAIPVTMGAAFKNKG